MSQCYGDMGPRTFQFFCKLLQIKGFLPPVIKLKGETIEQSADAGVLDITEAFEAALEECVDADLIGPIVEALLTKERLDPIIQECIDKETLAPVILECLTKENLQDVILECLTKENLEEVINQCIENADLTSLVLALFTKDNLSEVIISCLTKENLSAVIISCLTKENLQPAILECLTKNNLEDVILQCLTKDNLQAAILQCLTKENLESVIRACLTKANLSEVIISCLTKENLAGVVASCLTKEALEPYILQCLTKENLQDVINQVIEESSYITELVANSIRQKDWLQANLAACLEDLGLPSNESALKEFVLACFRETCCGYVGGAICETPSVGNPTSTQTLYELPFSYPSGITGTISLDQSAPNGVMTVSNHRVQGNKVCVDIRLENNAEVGYNILIDKTAGPVAGSCTAPIDGILDIDGLVGNQGGSQIQKEVGGVVSVTNMAAVQGNVFETINNSPTTFQDDIDPGHFGGDASNLQGSTFTGSVQVFDGSTQNITLCVETCYYMPAEAEKDASGAIVSVIDSDGNNVNPANFTELDG